MELFKYDHILRLETGQPIGRVILRNEEDYQPLSSFTAALVKFPRCFNLKYNSLTVWIDGSRYILPEVIGDGRIQNRGTDDIISNLMITYIGE